MIVTILHFRCIFLFSLFLCGCASDSTSSRKIDDVAGINGFRRVEVQTSSFLITTYQKITSEKLPYVFYIEGDGRVTIAGGRGISPNPTPSSTIFFDLAVLDSRPNVVYVARPCQHIKMEYNKRCSDRSYWTDKRFSDDSVESINEVINKVNNGQKFSLIGYSGGGAIAILVAARNDLVKDIITLGGNLDHEEFTKSHYVPAMKGSLNPINYAQNIRQIPQLHLVGGKDRVVYPNIARKYVLKSNSVCVHEKIFPNNTHSKGWDEVWAQILSTPLTCLPIKNQNS